MDGIRREQMRRWIENWKRVGPVLEEERWTRLRSLSDDEARQAVTDVLALWQPGWLGDDGEGLLRHQQVFDRARRR
jgi:hypothetical protein